MQKRLKPYQQISRSKKLKKFEKEEEKRIEEAERNGSIIEGLGGSGGPEDNGDLNEPLLFNNREEAAPGPVGPQVQPIVQNNNQNPPQAVTIIPGLIVRQPNGLFRIC